MKLSLLFCCCGIVLVFSYSFSITEGCSRLSQLCECDGGVTPGQVANQQPSKCERKSRSSTSISDQTNRRERTDIHCELDGECVGCVFSVGACEVGRRFRGAPALRRPLKAFSADCRRGCPTNSAAFGPFKLLFLYAGKQRVVIKRCAAEGAHLSGS